MNFPVLPPFSEETGLEMRASRSKEHTMSRESYPILSDEGDIGQLTRLPHLVEAVCDSCQFRFMRNFVHKVVGYGDVIDFLDPCGAQESAVAPKELPHAALVGSILLIEEELYSRLPSPFFKWIVDIEE